MTRPFLVLCISLFLPWSSLVSQESAQQPRIHRSAKARRDFKRESPCPSTGESTGKCPGYVIDHIVPLACGGEDAPENMQWQTVEDAKEKDRVERQDCGRGERER